MNLDIIPNGAIKRVHVSQNDVGRTLTFELFNNSTSYTIPSGATVKIQGTKPSGFGFSETCTVNGNTVTVDTTETMTDEFGYIEAELQITNSGNVIGTSNFVLAVERNPHPDTITDGSTATIISELTLLVNEVKGYAEEIEDTYHAYGSPWVASTVAEMTDTDKIYVYTGSETGYTSGNWYYYNGSAWVSGGVYNAVAVQTDTTLSVSGMSADAEATGDTIGNLDNSYLFEQGNIGISGSGWVYGIIANGSPPRVRTKEGTTIHLKVGTTIGLTDYTKHRYYLGWKVGSSYYYAGWLTSNYTVTQEGDYVVLITTKTDAPNETPSELMAIFFGYQAVAFDWIEHNANNIDDLATIKFDTHTGYIASDGTIATASEAQEVYTDMLSCRAGDVINIDLTYTSTVYRWLAYALYDANGGFISRSVLVTTAETATYYYGSLTIPSGASFIAFTYRTYGDSPLSLTSYNRSVNANSILTRLVALEQSSAYTDYAVVLNQNVKGVNHRGYCFVAPENTLPAYKMSRQKGFLYVETDVSLTSDDVPVLLHDDTINRTARNADGSEISSTINISDITYEQALTYDFGIWMGNEYAGTKIPTFAEFMKLCRNLGLRPYVEIKPSDNFTRTHVQNLVDIVKKHGMGSCTTWISFDATYLSYVKDYDDTARLGYLSNTVTSTAITTAQSLKTSKNEVFLDTYAHADEDCELCFNSDMPLEIWTFDSPTTIENLNPYITGVTSNVLIAGQVLYDANI